MKSQQLCVFEKAGQADLGPNTKFTLNQQASLSKFFNCCSSFPTHEAWMPFEALTVLEVSTDPMGEGLVTYESPILGSVTVCGHLNI